MNRFERWSLRVLFISWLGCSVALAANVPTPEYITVRDGLPQGFIKSLVQDRRGFIWLATRDGLCRYDGVRFRVYTHDARQPKSLSFSSVLDIKEDVAGKLWVSTEENHIDCFDPVTEQSRRVSDSPQYRQALGRDQLVSICPDRHGNVWVATQTNGFFRLHADGTVSHRHWAIKNDTVQRTLRAMLLDRQEHPWLAARDGLYRYDPSSKKFAGFRIAQGLPQNDVLTIHERSNGELMLGFPGRFALFDPKGGLVRQVIALPGNPGKAPLFAKDYRGTDYVDQNRFTDKSGLVPLPYDPKLARFPALSIMVDRSNVLWIGLNGDGVIKYDLNTHPFRTWPYVINFHTDWLSQQLGIPVDAIPAPIRQQSSFYLRAQFDRSKALWLSSPEIVPYRYDAVSRSFASVKPTGIEAKWLPNGIFRLSVMATGSQGELWGLLGPNNQAVARYNPDLGTFTAFPLPLPANHQFKIQAMSVDGGRIYLATKHHGLLRADLSTQRLIRWHAGGTDSKALPNDALLCLAQDPSQYNHLWIGTFGSGLCQLDKITGQIKQFTMANGLPNNVIYSILPDGHGHLWLSTNRGLCRFDSRTYEYRNYTTDDGLPSEEFNRFHDIVLPDGRLVFGGIGGYTAFEPSQISEDTFKPVVALTSLRINNQSIRANRADSLIQQDINETSEIELDHHQNFLSFDFAALQFNQMGKNHYRYKLIGLDNDWVYSGNQATATYTNLSPATYTFVVNASNTSGIWSPHTRQIRVVIRPPVWATWWAYLIYVVLLLGAIALFIRVRINRIRLKSRMELREQETVQLKHLDEIKTRFFANITHEFRTPLTLILTPLEQLLQDSVNDSKQHERLSLIHRNANRLLRLINELLDLAKLEAGSLKVTPAPGDLVEFVERTVLTFKEEAQRKQIQLVITNQLPQSFYWFDTDKLEKVLHNLLYNALKFTGENGSITISTLLGQESVNPGIISLGNTERIRLVVQDTGTGIEAQKLLHIFNRFYQADPLSDGSARGSGIGLALVKELTEMMQGTVSVTSQPNVGTTFVIEIPLRTALASAVSDVPFLQTTDKSDKADTPNSTVDLNAPRLLVVEDNDDIAEYLLTILSPEWRVNRVNNGQAGLEAALADGPDLIVSDVLMPQMDGYELCRQLKANPVTSHIPILLLTAKAAVESRIEGLTAGADDYLSKPFQVDELRGRVRNRLEQQQRMRQHYRVQLIREGHLPTTSQAPEDDFMNRVYAVLEARLDDSTFGVEPLATVIGMSRMHLNRKIKAMTGMTPNELIRVVRLNRAAELLLTGASVSEVADLVGFDTPAYFSKVFKEHYHLTPSEYVEKNRQEVI